jgi:hypothetical protein
MAMPRSIEPNARSSPAPMRFGVVAGALLAVLVLAGCSDDDSGDAAGSDPAAVLAAYQETRNSGDVDAVMAFYAEDAVVENDDGVATGVSEIRILEAEVPGIQGSTGGIEFTDLVVSGNTVTFKETFMNEAGDCFSSAGNEVTIEDGKITLYVWGDEGDSPSLCG